MHLRIIKIKNNEIIPSKTPIAMATSLDLTFSDFCPRTICIKVSKTKQYLFIKLMKFLNRNQINLYTMQTRKKDAALADFCIAPN